MSSKAPEFDAIRQREYRSRTLQFLSGLAFPATKEQILAFYMRKNTPMELMEDTMAIEARSFTSAAEFATAITAIHAARSPHIWTSREIHD
jgi:hypothetical protein